LEKVLKHKIVLKKSVIAVALTLASSHIVMAQQAPADQPMHKVTVTGSNIKRVDKEGTSAVQIVTTAEIRASGASSVQELLQKIPAMGTGASFDTTDGGFSRGVATASLRGLGSAATLILLNGRRMTPSAYADPNNGKSTAYDLNNIPLSAIERVEIFKDGASAVYGSDAIAGVINFITRQDYQGAELKASIGANDANKFGTKNASGVIGFGNLATDRYNGFVAFDVSKRDSALTRDVNDIETAMYADINGRLNPLSSNLSGSPFFYKERTPGAKNFANSLSLKALVINSLNCDPSQQITGNAAAHNLGSTSTLIGRTFCNFNLNDYNEAQSAGKDASLFSRGTFQLSQDTSVFTELAATRSDRTYLGAPRAFQSTSGSTVFNLNGAPSTFQMILPVGHPDNPFPTARSAVGLRMVGHPGGTSNYNDTYRALIGVKGVLAGWDWESGLLWNRNERTEHYYGMLYKPTFNKVMTQNMTLAQLLADPTSTRDLTNRGFSQTTQLDAKASNEFGQLGGGAIGVAFGGELRQEKIGLTPDAATEAGDIIGLSNSSADGSRHVSSGFIEFRTPFTKSFEMDWAGRYDKYPTFAGNFSPKVGAKWTVTPTVALRANFAKGFRAPALTQVSPGGVQFFQTVTDPIRCNDGVTAAPGADQADCAKGISGVASANPDLLPEKSKSYTLGLIWSPNKDMDVTIDGYHIRKEGETALQSTDFILNRQDQFPNRVIRDTNQATWLVDANGKLIPNSGPLQQVLVPYINQGATEVNGVDMEVTLRNSLGEYGSLSNKASVGYTFSYLRSENPGDTENNAAGSNGGLSDWATSVGDIPHFKSSLLSTWKKGPHEASLLVRYTGNISLLRRTDNDVTYPVPYCYYGTGQPSTAYSLGGLPKFSNYVTNCEVKSFTTLDVGYSYTGFKDLTLSMSIQNILDTMQPYDPRNGVTGINTGLSNGSGRYFRASASYKFK
jgi:iron complex outermembrane recepter protein